MEKTFDWFFKNLGVADFYFSRSVMKPYVMVSNRRALQIPSTLYRSPYKSPLIVRYATCLNRRVILKRDYGLKSRWRDLSLRTSVTSTPTLTTNRQGGVC